MTRWAATRERGACAPSLSRVCWRGGDVRTFFGVGARSSSPRRSTGLHLFGRECGRAAAPGGFRIHALELGKDVGKAALPGVNVLLPSPAQDHPAGDVLFPLPEPHRLKCRSQSGGPLRGGWIPELPGFLNVSPRDTISLRASSAAREPQRLSTVFPAAGEAQVACARRARVAPNDAQ